ncbi:hypothetical protein B0H11DRAFT_2242357, partial [Mycena galericulata]
MSALRGSTQDNPWYLQDSGTLVLQGNGVNHTAGRAPASPAAVPNQLRINKGPPSTIPRDFAAPGGAACSGVVLRGCASTRARRQRSREPAVQSRCSAQRVVLRAPLRLPPGLTAQVTEAIRTLSRPAPDAQNPRPEAVARQRERAARVARDDRERAAYIARQGGGAVRARSGPRIRPRPVPGADA